VRGGYRHAALLGTSFTMSGPVYPEMFEKHAVKVSSPAERD
jgi:aspartate/glutamate racemase